MRQKGGEGGKSFEKRRVVEKVEEEEVEKVGELPGAHARHRSEAAQSSTSLRLNRNLKS